MQPDAKDLGRLRDIIDWGREAIDLLGCASQEAFVSDRRTYLAILHCIQVVGEAGWSLSDEIKKQRSEIPWPLIAGMRHRLVHDYGRIDPKRIYSVLRQGLPELIDHVEDLLNEFESS